MAQSRSELAGGPLRCRRRGQFRRNSIHISVHRFRSINSRHEYASALRGRDGWFYEEFRNSVPRSEALDNALAGTREGAGLHLRKIEMRLLTQPNASHQTLKSGLITDGVKTRVHLQPCHHWRMLAIRLLEEHQS